MNYTGASGTPSTSGAPIQILSHDIVIPSFALLASYTDMVILGTVISKEGIINSARIGEDHSKPAPIFSISQVYLVQVERYIKGEGPGTIYLKQGQGRLYREVAPEETPDPAEIEQAMAEAEGKSYVPLELGRRYLFFLNLFDDEDYEIGGYRANQLYARAGDRWTFDATDLEHIRYEGVEPVSDASMFDGLTLNDMSLDEIIARINFTPMPTPYPGPDWIDFTPTPLPYPEP